MFGDKYFPSVYFGNRYFGQALGFDVHLIVTDLDVLRRPVNCVLAGSVPIKDRYREYEIPAYKRSEKTTFSSTPARRLKGPPPSSWTKTDNRGYD